MPDLLIRGIPDHIHMKLKLRAEKHHRSVNKEVLALLEEVMETWTGMPEDPPEPFKGNFLLTDGWLQQAREEGRP